MASLTVEPPLRVHWIDDPRVLRHDRDQTYGDSVGADVKPDCRHPRLTLKANSEGI
jgi:hypothetical protein